MTIKLIQFEKPIPIVTDSWDWQRAHQPKIIECHEPLVNAGFCPERIVASPEYFNQGISGTMSTTYSRRNVYRRLVLAANQLPVGYKLVLLDAWRSNETQTQLFELLKQMLTEQNSNLTEAQVLQRTLATVAPPTTDIVHRPAPHNTGGAVDLLIVDDLGVPLDFGTPFDDHTEVARTSYFEEKQTRTELDSAEIAYRDHRRLLYNMMVSVGFTNDTDEWWHFDYGNQNWAWQSGADHAIYGAIEPPFTWRKPY